MNASKLAQLQESMENALYAVAMNHQAMETARTFALRAIMDYHGLLNPNVTRIVVQRDYKSPESVVFSHLKAPANWDGSPNFVEVYVRKLKRDGITPYADSTFLGFIGECGKRWSVAE